MTTLMIYAGAADERAAVTRTGGVPLVPADFSWPACQTCEGPMQFLAQVLLADLGPAAPGGVLSLFMCQNDPGLCDEWDPELGGNQAFLFSGPDLRPAAVPVSPVTMLGAVSAVRYAIADGDYDTAREAWTESPGHTGRDVIGQLGGEPSWLQNEETPACPACAAPMTFVVQLEEGHDHRTAANFGGAGSAYAFTCYPCTTAGFLWQC
jgi:hypothetical protein